jgi:hypothetical protein
MPEFKILNSVRKLKLRVRASRDPVNLPVNNQLFWSTLLRWRGPLELAKNRKSKDGENGPKLFVRVLALIGRVDKCGERTNIPFSYEITLSHPSMAFRRSSSQLCLIKS